MARINPKITRFFEALSDETRLRILVSISKKPLTVGDIHKSVEGLTLSAISHQLAIMSSLGMVISEKKGRNKYFRLSHNFCWCILKDAFNYFKKTHKCPGCANIEDEGGFG